MRSIRLGQPGLTCKPRRRQTVRHTDVIRLLGRLHKFKTALFGPSERAIKN